MNANDKMALAVAEAIIKRREVSWIAFSTGEPVRKKRD